LKFLIYDFKDSRQINHHVWDFQDTEQTFINGTAVN